MSYLAIMAEEYIKAKSEILKVTHIDRDQYSELMFRHGTLFAEQFCKRFLNKHTVLTSLLQDSSYGYWDWWKTKYEMDDIQLHKHKFITSTFVQGGLSYEEMKECMIGDNLLEDDLFILIQHRF